MIGLCVLVFLRHLFEGQKLLQKLDFFDWAATLEKVPTEDFSKRRNFHGPSRCVLCREEEESVHHLLVHCRGLLALAFETLFDGC